MRLFARQVDRDFPGGLYLDPLGPIPPVDHIETVAPADELRIPLLHPDVASLVRPGDAVIPGQPIAAGRGYTLHAPAAATVGPTTTVWCRDRGSQSALTLHVSASQPLVEPLRLPDADLPPLDNPDHARRRIANALQHAGILTSAGRPFADSLQKLAHRSPSVVIANAVPLEPNLNAPLALLNCFGPEVFAGLAILKTVLHAAHAWMAYPVGFPLDTRPAEPWDVRCVEVSEKYPQARDGAILKTLQRQKLLPRQRPGAVVFSLETLREVEAAVLRHQPLTHRLITLCGDGIDRPAHFLAPLGTPLPALLDRIGLHAGPHIIAEGSSLAGAALDPERVVIDPAASVYSVLRHAPLVRPQACIRCGWCIDDCPARLDPAALLALAETGQYLAARNLRPEKCVECGICSYVCPSHLPLMEHIQLLKHELPLPDSLPEAQP